MLLHYAQELDNNLRARPDENLTLASFLSVVDRIQRIVEDTRFDHCDGLRFSTRVREVRYLQSKRMGRISLQEL